MFEALGNDQTFKTDTDLSAKQYFLVKMDTNEDTTVICGDHGAAIGVLQNNPPTGTAAVVRCAKGVKTRVIGATGGITVGDILESDASGRATPFTYSATGATECYMVGTALSASSNPDEYVTMLTAFSPSSQSA